jgi:hypothetical protein
MINDQIINAETGEIEIVVVSPNEIKKREAEGLAKEALLAEAATQKAALLAKLGITDDEAKLLLS